MSPRGLPAPAERTAARPGPGPVPPAVLRALDLAVLRRVESLIPGEHLTPQVGAGTELAGIRPYFPGDDVRHIDWNVTARMREPHVRVHVGERALTTWLVLDTSASMTFGTADRRKADVAEGVALAIGHVATRRGNRLGLVGFGARRAAHRAPAAGPAGAAVAAGGAAGRAGGRRRRRDLGRRRRCAPVRVPPASAGWWSSSRTSAASATGPIRCARCAPATACSRSRSATRASRSSRPPASCGWSTRRPAASCRSTPPSAACASASPAPPPRSATPSPATCATRAPSTWCSRPPATGCATWRASCAAAASPTGWRPRGRRRRGPRQASVASNDAARSSLGSDPGWAQ